jgi:hypothetical protein
MSQSLDHIVGLTMTMDTIESSKNKIKNENKTDRCPNKHLTCSSGKPASATSCFSSSCWKNLPGVRDTGKHRLLLG